jgi:formate-dependent phosphoribosylglycinamide formyltransferase (GAR transformylase)
MLYPKKDGVADIKLALKEIKSIASDINTTLGNWSVFLLHFSVSLHYIIILTFSVRLPHERTMVCMVIG